MLSISRTRRMNRTSVAKRLQEIRHRRGLLNFNANRKGRYGEACWSPNGWTVCCSYPGLANPICTQTITG